MTKYSVFPIGEQNRQVGTDTEQAMFLFRSQFRDCRTKIRAELRSDNNQRERIALVKGNIAHSRAFWTTGRPGF